MADLLARAGAGKWQGVKFRLGETGVPLLEGAVASFECEVEARHEAGDHLVVVGRVLRLHVTEHDEPLVFFRSHYRHLAPVSGAEDAAGEPAFLAWGL